MIERLCSAVLATRLALSLFVSSTSLLLVQLVHLLMHLDVKKSTGPDGIFARFLREAIESKLTKLVKDIELKLTDHCKQVTAKIAGLSSDSLMDTTPSPNNSNLSHKDISHAVSSVLQEEKEKSKRKLNLILHNMPESNAEGVDQRKQHDIDTVTAIINQHLNIPASFSNVIRLGKKAENSDKPRLLRITVESDQTKAKILRNCTKIRSFSDPEYLQQVYITPDLTKKEREENKLLRSKLTEMNNGQKKYWIKNGQIVLRRN